MPCGLYSGLANQCHDGGLNPLLLVSHPQYSTKRAIQDTKKCPFNRALVLHCFVPVYAVILHLTSPSSPRPPTRRSASIRRVTCVGLEPSRHPVGGYPVDQDLECESESLSYTLRHVRCGA